MGLHAHACHHWLNQMTFPIHRNRASVWTSLVEELHLVETIQRDDFLNQQQIRALLKPPYT
eukprot:scaffold43396_cov16-Prasinocladus_malaysianus.AAC.1